MEPLWRALLENLYGSATAAAALAASRMLGAGGAAPPPPPGAHPTAVPPPPGATTPRGGDGASLRQQQHQAAVVSDDDAALAGAAAAAERARARGVRAAYAARLRGALRVARRRGDALAAAHALARLAALRGELLLGEVTNCGGAYS